ncbi:MAG: hypothetical protein K2J80_06685 [Oscillospiraceae bacterium]|nr:hypothetical protein [Oscillospiraceae bacterium]
MNKTIEKKLLHFFTGGDIFADFSEARARKVAVLRRVVRICFYVHCAAAVLCIVLAAMLGAGLGTIVVAGCELIITGLAFLSVGDMLLMKVLLCGGDIALAAAMFVTGALSANTMPFTVVGGISAGAVLCAVAALIAALLREYLENYSPLALRREHYTLLRNLSYDPIDDTPDLPEEPIIVLPPPKTEIQELADKLKEILCSPKTGEAPAVPEAEPEKSEPTDIDDTEDISDTADDMPPQTEVLQ